MGSGSCWGVYFPWDLLSLLVLEPDWQSEDTAMAVCNLAHASPTSTFLLPALLRVVSLLSLLQSHLTQHRDWAKRKFKMSLASFLLPLACGFPIFSEHPGL